MQRGVNSLIKRPLHALAFKRFGNVGSACALHHVLGTGDLAPADRTVMVASALAGRGAAGIDEKLRLFLVGELFKNIKIVVEIIVQNYEGVVLFHLCGKLVKVLYLLAGGAGYGHIGELVSDVVLQHGGEHDSFVHAVVRSL